MKELGIGISTSVGIGGDPINGSSFRDILELFERDPDTHAVMMIGEIGGPQEAEAAEFIARAYDQAGHRLCGGTLGAEGPQAWAMPAPSSRPSARARSEKVEMLRDAGVAISPTPAEIGSVTQKVLKAA